MKTRNGMWSAGKIDCLDITSFCNGLVFYAPVALLVRTMAGVSAAEFFVLQGILSGTIFLMEIPSGKLTDRIGYRNTLVGAQVLLLLARGMLLAAFLRHSFPLFVAEAVVEGIAACFASGTQSAYLYTMFSDEEFVVKSAHVGNCGTAGFIVSTIAYAGMYALWGIRGLIIATLISSGMALGSSLGIKKESGQIKEGAGVKTEDVKMRKKSGLWKKLLNGKSILVILVLAAVSMSFLLINFFYVDKLTVCGYKETWMTAIILGYSAIQMLAEKILGRLKKKQYAVAFGVGFGLAGVCMVVFGYVVSIWIALPIMLILPLMITVPAYIFEEVQNRLIDGMGEEEHRAEILSCYNMLVNLLEIVFLFASAALASAGIGRCFLTVGAGTAILGCVSFKLLKSYSYKE
ncbi:MAG: MFS transporter [Lachnospiraceae bacterium]|nr:MFS transporter [Lachnospiraceae bacterium]